MARTVSTDARRMVVTFRVNADEATRLAHHAQAAGHPSVSAYARAALLEQRQREAASAASAPMPVGSGDGEAPATPPVSADPRAAALAEQLRRVGVNLNQLTRYINTLRAIPPEVVNDLAATLADVRSVVRQARVR